MASSSIIYLSDCTPLYTTLGAPERITSVVGTPLHRYVRLEWQLPPNSDKVVIDSYIIRYKLTTAPTTHVLNEFVSFFPSFTVSGLSNGVSYDFWVVAKNRFGESPHSPTISVVPGSAPSACQVVRRAYHSTTAGDGIQDISGAQKVGIEFTPGITQNGAAALTFTAKYTRLSGGPDSAMTDISYIQVYSVQSNEYMLDVSGQRAINSIGFKGNYLRKEILPPTGLLGWSSGNYRFQVFSSNIYGSSPVPDLSFNVYLYSNADANDPVMVPRFTAPTLASYTPSANGGIIAVDASNTSFRFRWKQYRGSGTGSTGDASYNGWSYRIQYTDDKDNWYYPVLNPGDPNSAYYPEYTRAYDRTSPDATTPDFEYSIVIHQNVVNGRRYYVRYCVVNANGDTSEYTQVTPDNLSIVSCIPGKLPNPPPIFRASSADRMVRLYFDWNTRPPSINVTGGLPILDYRIERYDVIRVNGNVVSISNEPAIVYNNVIGPYMEDTYDIVFNGFEYEYHVFARNAFGYSATYSSVRAIPYFPSDVVRNVGSSVSLGQITLSWDEPETIDIETPIVQYYIEYKLYTLYNISDIPAGNIIGGVTGETTISNTFQDMNRILVDDTLWDKIPGTPTGIYTFSTLRSYTVSGLFNNTAYVFRIAAVAQDVARRKIIGLRKVIASNSPYLPRPVIIGKAPTGLINIEFVNGDGTVTITWSSNDIQNTEEIIRFIVDYDIAPGEAVYSQRQTFDYAPSVVFNDGSTSVSFRIIVTGLNNNVAQRPDTETNSYVMKIYAENSVSFTNDENKVRVHEIYRYTNTYENVKFTRVLRPMTGPSVILEIRQ
jgi:hypothetical protein